MILEGLRKVYSGVSWRHPVIAVGLRVLDPLDWLVRGVNGRAALPRYSVRVRSNGLRSQFGGGKFQREGSYIAELLARYANLGASSRVLEIGCGCGRTAIPLARTLTVGSFHGVDIDQVSIQACQRNSELQAKLFKFEWMDVFNREYNDGGSQPASSFRFPMTDDAYDIVFLVSVFTHMLPNDVANYIGEIARMLRPGGRCFFTTFLMDHGRSWQTMSFPYDFWEAMVYKHEFPEIAVGYRSDFFIEHFARHGMGLSGAPRAGTWRGSDRVFPHTSFPQDILVFSKG